MRPGTPGFVSARLTQAREARGLSLTNLADLVDISRESISKYERGGASPGPDILARVCDKLGMPQSFFVQPTADIEKSALFYRSMSSTGATARKRAAVLHEWLHDVSRHLERFVDMPVASIPEVSTLPPERLSSGATEEAATQLRRQWGMGDGPISDITLLLENHGTVMARAPLDLDGLDGLSGWFGDRPVILLSSDKETAVRSRLDAAHELGHLTLHRGVKTTAINSKPMFRLIETQAFRFGAAFLFPAKSFAVEARPFTLEHLVELKRRWKVSVAMMLFRAKDLNLLDAQAAQYLWRKYTYLGWRKREPLDDDLPVERPRMLPRAIDLLFNASVFSRSDLHAQLHLPPQDVERLAGLEGGALSDKPMRVVAIQPRLRPSADGGTPHGEGTVLAFRAKTS